MSKRLFSLFIFMIFISGCAFTNNQVSTRKARVVYYVPKTVDNEKVKDALLKAISLRTQNVKDLEEFMPERLPEKPGHPIGNNVLGNLDDIVLGNPKIEAAKLDVSNAWYKVEGTEEIGTPLDQKYVIYKGAIYPYKKGYKVYIYEFYQEGTAGIVGHITKAIEHSIIKEKTPLFFMTQISKKFKEEVPEAKLESVSPISLKKTILNK